MTTPTIMSGVTVDAWREAVMANHHGVSFDVSGPGDQQAWVMVSDSSQPILPPVKTRVGSWDHVFRVGFVA